MLQFLNATVAKYAAIALAAVVAVGAVFKAGKDSQKVSQSKQEDKHRANEANIRADVDSMSGDAARKRLRDKWSKQ